MRSLLTGLAILSGLQAALAQSYNPNGTVLQVPGYGPVQIPVGTDPQIIANIQAAANYLSSLDIQDGYLYGNGAAFFEIGNGQPLNIPGYINDGQSLNPSTINLNLQGSAYIYPTYGSNTDVLYRPVSVGPSSIAAPVLNATAQTNSSGTNYMNVVATALGQNYTTLNVHFHTAFALGTVPTLKYGTSNGSFSQVATGSSKNYGTACSLVNATLCSAFFHDITLTGLSDNTVYYYQISADSSSGLPTSKVYSVRTAIAPGAATPFNVSFVADMGLTNAAGTRNGLLAMVPSTDFIIHAGDISYADTFSYAAFGIGGLNGGDVDIAYEASYDIWQWWLTNLTSQLPYMVAPGNHDASCAEGDVESCPSYETNFTSYQTRWNMPSSSVTTPKNMWYSFDVGLVHFVAIDTETDYVGDNSAGEGPTLPYTPLAAGEFGTGKYASQLSWLDADLAKANANRANVPFIIVFGHKPHYTSELDSYPLILRSNFEPIFMAHDVDMYFSGHIHDYERLYPQAYNQTVPTDVVSVREFVLSNKSVTYIVGGNAGNVENHSDIPTTPFIDAAYDRSSYGFSQLQVLNRTHLLWTSVRGVDGVIIDQAFLHK